MPSRLLHRNITVSDLDASLRFYREGLDFQPIGRSPVPVDHAALLGVPEVQGTTAYVRNEQGVTLALTCYDNPAGVGSRERNGFDRFGYTHLAFYVDDMEKAAARLEAAGGTVHRHTHARYGEAGVEMMYCTDPDGVRVELMTGPNIPAAFSHSGQCCATIKGALPFYAALGFETEDSWDFSEPLDWVAKITETPGLRQVVHMLRNADGDHLEILEILHPRATAREHIPPLNAFGFGSITVMVDDPDQTAQALAALGGRFPDEKRLTRDGQVVRFGTSPWDARIELIATIV